MRQARGETVERWTPELNLGLSGRLPPDWIPEPEIRIALYARLARLESEAAIDALEEELADRFGALPEQAEILVGIARIRALARLAEIGRVDAGPGGIALTPRSSSNVSATASLQDSNGRLIAKERIDDAALRLDRVRQLLEEIVATD